MPRSASEHPTELELQILKILWDRSPLAVRTVREALADQGREIAHTSAITTLNIMVRKGYLKRERDGKSYLFSPKVQQKRVSTRILHDVVDRVFNGSVKATLLNLFDHSDIDERELEELRELIERKAKEQSND